jgi:hypothetical protein
MGPFKVIGKILMDKNGSIQGYQQNFSFVMIGPFMAIGSFSHEQQCAHS